MPRARTAPSIPHELVSRLRRAIVEPFCELDHADAWQLLVATILSAQSTDKTINRVTPDLFARWPRPADLAKADLAEVENVVKPTGFFRNKAKSIVGTARAIVDRHGGEVPRTLEALIELPGVARKTANVVLGTGYGIASGIAVDTHVGRVARRLALSKEESPEKVEHDLCASMPREDWVADGHRLLLHGRYVCLARTPRCERCPLNELCPSREAEPTGQWTQRAAAENRTVASRGDVPLDD